MSSSLKSKFLNFLESVKILFLNIWSFIKKKSVLLWGKIKPSLDKILEPVKRRFKKIYSKADYVINGDNSGKQKIELALDDLKHELIFLDMFNILLNTLITFLVALLFAVIIGYSWEWSFGIAIIGFFVFGYLYIKETRLVRVEEKVPELSERLRTAADNVEKTNEITEDLKEEVVHDMKKIQTRYFFDIDAVAVRLFSISVLAFIIIIVSFLDLTFDFQLAPIISDPISAIRERVFNQDIGNASSLQFSVGNLSNAYGNKSALIKLGDEELRLEVNPLQSEMNFEDVKDAEMQNFNPPVYPKEIYTSYDASYTEKIAKKNQAVVKSYFEQISGN